LEHAVSPIPLIKENLSESPLDKRSNSPGGFTKQVTFLKKETIDRFSVINPIITPLLRKGASDYAED
jgi:hypothetical protein